MSVMHRALGLVLVAMVVATSLARLASAAKPAAMPAATPSAYAAHRFVPAGPPWG